MPNWVSAKLIISGPKSSEVMKNLLTKDDENSINFDFNKIIEMPKELEIVKGSFTDKCVQLYLTALNPKYDYIGKDIKNQKEYDEAFELVSSKKLIANYNKEIKESELDDLFKYSEPGMDSLEDLISYGKTAIENYKKYQSMDWYEWSIKNWGTKWNACHTVYDEQIPNEVYFDTAWSNVAELMELLSTKYSENEFNYIFAEEWVGTQTGNLGFKNGELIYGAYYQDGSKEAYEQSFNLLGRDLSESFVFDEKKNTYIYKEPDENSEEEEM